MSLYEKRGHSEESSITTFQVGPSHPNLRAKSVTRRHRFKCNNRISFSALIPGVASEPPKSSALKRDVSHEMELKKGASITLISKQVFPSH